MNKKISNIIGILIIIIFLPILVINLLLIIKSYMYPDKAPNVFGYKPFIVLSGSMEPQIMTGDIVIIKNCNKDDLKKNDIIAFRSGKSVITHRIIDIIEEDGEKEFITQGDNNNTEDRDTVKLKDIEGIFVGRIPKLGNFAMFLQTALGAIIFISIPFVLFIIVDIIYRKQENKEKIEKLEKELNELKKEQKKNEKEKVTK